LDGIDLGHDLLVSSLLSETFQQLDLSISLKLHCLGDHRGNLLLRLGNSGSSVSICLSDGLSSISLRLFYDLSLNELGLSDNLVVFQICFCIDLIDKSRGLGFPLRPDPRGLGLDLFNLLSFLHLLERGLLVFILSLFFLDLLGLDFLLCVILDPLVVRESLSLQSVLELEDGLFLHGVSDLTVEHHVGDNATLDDDSFIVEVCVQMLLHTGRVLLST